LFEGKIPSKITKTHKREGQRETRIEERGTEKHKREREAETRIEREGRGKEGERDRPRQKKGEKR
jgi:hypothetical protein